MESKDLSRAIAVVDDGSLTTTGPLPMAARPWPSSGACKPSTTRPARPPASSAKERPAGAAIALPIAAKERVGAARPLAAVTSGLLRPLPQL